MPDAGLFPSFLGERMQLGLVVSDMEVALRFWTEGLKVGPFVVIEDSFGDRRFVHRGREIEMKMSVAFSYLGDTQIELVVQSNSSPSPYTEFLESSGGGLHHVAFWPDDFDQSCKELERLGLEEVTTIHMPDGMKNVSFFSSSQLGVMIELIPWTPARRRYVAGIKALAEAWDGSRPVRRFRTRADFLASDECKV